MNTVAIVALTVFLAGLVFVIIKAKRDGKYTKVRNGSTDNGKNKV